MRTKCAVLIVVLSGLLFIGLTGCVSCPSNGSVEAYDGNGDGIVERSELWEGMKQQSFAEIDGNEDMSVSREEWNRRKTGGEVRGMFEDIDADHDGRISFPEFSAHADRNQPDVDRIFRRMDQDTDGYLSSPEINSQPVGTLADWRF